VKWDFDASEFNQSDRAGECNAILVMKHWGTIANITGFFLTESGEKIKATESGAKIKATESGEKIKAKQMLGVIKPTWALMKLS
jgi:hypothetical protein